MVVVIIKVNRKIIKIKREKKSVCVYECKWLRGYKKREGEKKERKERVRVKRKKELRKNKK